MVFEAFAIASFVWRTTALSPLTTRTLFVSLLSDSLAEIRQHGS